MDKYTNVVLKVIGMPRRVNIQSKQVDPAILFSPAVCEPLLFWQASAISLRLHGESVMHADLVASPDDVSGVKLLQVDREPSPDSPIPSMGLSSSLMMLCAAGDEIIAPARRHQEFDYGRMIFMFRDAVRKNYDAGEIIKPDDHVLSRVVYDEIISPARNEQYAPPAPRQRVAR